MSLTTAAVDYITKIIRVPGMKALMLDSETMHMVGLCYSLSSLIQHQVFLTEQIDRDKPTAVSSSSSSPSSSSGSDVELHERKEERMPHLKCLCFLRPSRSSLIALRALLASHRFAHYHLYFTAILTDMDLRDVAASDVHSLVESVHEYYLDFYVMHPHLFHLGVDHIRALHASPSYWLGKEKAALKRQVDGLCGVLLSLKKQVEVRYVDKSEICRTMAHELYRHQQEDRELFAFSAQMPDPPPLLLLLDRRNDPISPLLMQWTYTAMVHELLTIVNNRVNLAHTPQLHKDLHEVTLSPTSDHFYKGSQWLNFGDLGQSIKDLVSDFQRKTKNSARLDSIEAMQRFMDGYPEFRSLSGTVSKHVAVVSEMSRLVEQRRLMAVSEVEQELACNEDLYGAGEKVEKLVKDNKVQFDDALRLVMLYALRYEGQENAVPRLRAQLREKAGDDREKRRRVALVDDIIKYAGSKQRSGDLYGNTKSFLARATQLVSGIRGIENIYTQHKPLLAEIVVSRHITHAQSVSIPPARHVWPTCDVVSS